MRDAIRMVCHLYSGLPAGAELALADRIGRVPFELPRKSHLHDTVPPAAEHFRVAFDHAYGQTAASLTQRTDARLPLGHARHEVVVRNEADQVVLGTAAARQRRARAGHRRQLDEVASVHQK